MLYITTEGGEVIFNDEKNIYRVPKEDVYSVEHLDTITFLLYYNWRGSGLDLVTALKKDITINGKAFSEGAMEDLYPSEGGGGGGIEFKIVDELPQEGEKGVIYLVPNGDGTYSQYVYVNNAWIPLGSSAVEGDPIFTAWKDGESIACGLNASASLNSLAIGHEASATTTESIAIGWGALASGTASSAFGKSTQSMNDDAIAIGHYTYANHPKSIALGAYVKSGSDTHFVVSSQKATRNNMNDNISKSFEIKDNNDIYIWKNSQFVKLQDKLGGGATFQYDADTNTLNIITQ